MTHPNKIPRLARVLAVLRSLCEDEQLVSDLQERHGVSRATLYRDLEALQDAGLEIVTRLEAGLAHVHATGRVQWDSASHSASSTARRVRVAALRKIGVVVSDLPSVLQVSRATVHRDLADLKTVDSEIPELFFRLPRAGRKGALKGQQGRRQHFDDAQLRAACRVTLRGNVWQASVVDAVAGETLGVAHTSVAARRSRLGIRACSSALTNQRLLEVCRVASVTVAGKTRQRATVPDREAAAAAGVSVGTILRLRKAAKILAHQGGVVGH